MTYAAAVSRARGLRLAIALVPLLLLAIVAWWAFGDAPRPAPGLVAPTDDGAGASKATHWVPPARRDDASCTSHAAQVCKDGDVWWIDGCGEPEALARACGSSPCNNGACGSPPGTGCGDVTAFGRCDRAIARTCQVDHVVEIDCGAKGERCVITGDGPICRPPSADDCAPDATPQCRGQTLRSCVEGRWTALDCDATGGQCLAGQAGRPARCVFALPVLDADCGACGCAPEPSDEICDGRDNDGDAAIDEQVECAPVPILAVVIADDREQPSHSDEEVIAAVAELNAAFAREDGFGLAFELRDTITVVEPGFLDLDQADRTGIVDVDEWLARRGLATSIAEFHVPVLFTESLVVEDVPRPGLSTVPNGRCGGQRRIWERQPPVGYIALAKTRWPTTLAHEMGHFLGLCHTHEAPPPVERVAAEASLADAPVCDAARCPDDTDGLCDTAIDPGPAQCSVDATCLVHCATGDRPDVRNMMAYYPDCRSRFSEEQALLMRTTLAERRAWHACLAGGLDPARDGCTCSPTDDPCPDGMTCTPFDVSGATQWRCELEGPAMPGGTCSATIACGHGSVCVGTPGGESRCARTCVPGAIPCRCEDITDLGVRVCRDDLRLDAAP